MFLAQGIPFDEIPAYKVPYRAGVLSGFADLFTGLLDKVPGVVGQYYDIRLMKEQAARATQAEAERRRQLEVLAQLQIMEQAQPRVAPGIISQIPWNWVLIGSGVAAGIYFLRR